MAWQDEDDEISCEILEYYGSFSAERGTWRKELNLVSWNGRPAKIDLRSWRRDHEKCGKGLTLSRAEAEALHKLLGKMLHDGGKTKRGGTRKGPVVPQALEPFYDELELVFGSGPAECKAARNTMLKKYHPDTNPGKTAFATRKTIKIKEAYEKLMEFWNHAGPKR